MRAAPAVLTEGPPGPPGDKGQRGEPCIIIPDFSFKDSPTLLLCVYNSRVEILVCVVCSLRHEAVHIVRPTNGLCDDLTRGFWFGRQETEVSQAFPVKMAYLVSTGLQVRLCFVLRNQLQKFMQSESLRMMFSL